MPSTEITEANKKADTAITAPTRAIIREKAQEEKLLPLSTAKVQLEFAAAKFILRLPLLNELRCA